MRRSWAERAAACAAKGSTQIERVMTGTAFAWCHSNDVKRLSAALGVKRTFIAPHCPWKNGESGLKVPRRRRAQPRS